MKTIVENLIDPNFNDKLLLWFSLYGLGFITGMLIFENMCK